MALYDVRCNSCGRFDNQVLSMPRYGGAPEYQPCLGCGEAVARVYDAPADHSDNTFKPRWSDNLSAGADPVYVATKDHYRHLKAKYGLVEYEPGMSQDKKRNDAHRAERSREASFNRMFGELRP